MPKKLSRLLKRCRRGERAPSAETAKDRKPRKTWRFWRKAPVNGTAALVSVIEDLDKEDHGKDLGYEDRDKDQKFFEEEANGKRCKLCLSDVAVEDVRVMMACGCFFCQQCLREYVSHQVAQGDVDVACPDGQCPAEGRFLAEEMYALMDGKTRRKFVRFKLNREVENDPNRVWCPSPGCEEVCRLAPGSVKSDPAQVTCPTCGHRFCCACGAPFHRDRGCADPLRRNSANNDDWIPVSDETESPIKRCPSCQVPIERDDGCAQMMCRRCKHVFCWYCLASLDDDFLLRHFDDGPCKNRLGHSRALVVWHRIQVIGIFAGFGVLLLVASPLLLIAAPCILCCRTCKSGPCEDQGPSEAPSQSCA